jgi:hypothetical protein
MEDSNNKTKFASYCLRLLQRALGETKNLVVDKGWSVVISPALVVVSMLLVVTYGSDTEWGRILGLQSASAILPDFMVSLIASALLFVIWFVLNVLFWAPYRLWNVESELNDRLKHRVKTLERLATPSFGVVPHEGQGFVRADGKVLKSGITRKVQIVQSQSFSCVTFIVENNSKSGLEECVAVLQSAHIVDGNGEVSDLGIVETIRLPWSKDPDDLESELLPGERRRVFVGAVMPNGLMTLYASLSNQPLDYNLLFQQPGNFRLIVVVSSGESRPLTLQLDIDISAGLKPESGIQSPASINISQTILPNDDR